MNSDSLSNSFGSGAYPFLEEAPNFRDDLAPTILFFQNSLDIGRGVEVNSRGCHVFPRMPWNDSISGAGWKEKGDTRAPAKSALLPCDFNARKYSE